MTIPILIICHDNYKYVRNTLEQIKRINPVLYKDIIIIDNLSTTEKTVEFLKSVDVTVMYRKENGSPRISTEDNPDLYNMLPNKFILTDPDLEFNAKLPSNFVDILSNLSDTYGCHKIGFALDISDIDKMHTGKNNEFNVHLMEIAYWQQKIEHESYELYYAPIDTTFCLVSKQNTNQHIRVAGDFTAKHLPWYIDNPIYNIYELYETYSKQSSLSTIKDSMLYYIDTSFVKTEKNNNQFFIPKHDKNINFWMNEFPQYDTDVFNILDKYLDRNKIFIDIGAGIGAVSMYASRKSKHVFLTEVNNEFKPELLTNMQMNCIDNNFTFIDNHQAFTSLQSWLNQYHIDIREISFIKININGGEERILDELYTLHQQYNVPVLVYIYYDYWADKNLSKYNFLSDSHKEIIYNHSQRYILFDTKIIESFANEKNSKHDACNASIRIILVTLSLFAFIFSAIFVYFLIYNNMNRLNKFHIFIVGCMVLFMFIFVLYILNNKTRGPLGPLGPLEAFENDVHIQFVIARYNETTDWLADEPFKNRDVICYNKGPRLPSKCETPNCKIVELQNVGKCDHTYLYHIINNYHNLADVTIFLPGSWMDERKKNFTLDVINKAITTKTTVLEGHIVNDVKTDLYDFVLEQHVTANHENYSENSESLLTPSPIRPFGKWFQENFGDNLNVKVVCYYGIFAVAKEHIIQHDIEKYKKLLSYVDKSSNPEAGHYIERSWGALFYPYPESCVYDSHITYQFA